MSKKLKPAAISKLKEWRAKQMDEIKKREDALAEQLRVAIPASFNKWIMEEHYLISNLLEYGAASRKYRRGGDEGHSYGYTDLNEFERRFVELQKAWEGVVNLSISWDGDYRFEVSFTVV